MSQTIIFDWSGTLSNNFHSFCQVVQMMCDHFSKADVPSPEDVQRLFEVPYMTFWNKLFPDLTLEEQNSLYPGFMQQADVPKLYEGVKETILYLHEKGYKLFVLSSDHYVTLTPEVENSGVQELFTEVIGQTHSKVNNIKNICSRHGFNPAQTHYVGDTTGDVKEGELAGVKTVAVTWGYQHRDTISSQSSPDILINSISELKNYF